MKLYCVRDRLLDYFMQPFVGPGDKEVMAALSKTINAGGTSDIEQAPHHFELWQLALIAEDGQIIPERNLVIDCASLVRRDLRDRRINSRTPTAGDRGTDYEPPEAFGSYGGTDPDPLPSAAQAAAQALEEAPGGRASGN